MKIINHSNTEQTRIYATLRGARIAAAKFRARGCGRVNVYTTTRKTKHGMIDQRHKNPTAYAVYLMF